MPLTSNARLELRRALAVFLATEDSSLSLMLGEVKGIKTDTDGNV